MPGTCAARLQGLQLVIIIPVVAIASTLDTQDLCEKRLPALVLLSASATQKVESKWARPWSGCGYFLK